MMYATNGPFCSTAFKPTEWIHVSTSKEEYDGRFWCLVWQHGGQRKIPRRHDKKTYPNRFIKAVHKPFDTVTILDKSGFEACHIMSHRAKFDF
jgi:hypothetical protein